MEINTDLIMERYKEQYQLDNLDNIEEKKLKNAVTEFSSILLQKMFKSMRASCPDNKLIDGGFAGDIFTDMFDREVSKLGSEQDNFSYLNKLLYQQLAERRE